MRWDMYEVIIERPRVGGKYLRVNGRERERERDPEYAPLLGPISRGRGSKHLNENLAPLRRFLVSRVGRPWNEVHSEICADLRLTSAVQKHVLDHLRDMVYTHVVRAFDQLRVHGRNGVEPLGYRRRNTIAYVCPDTGRLALLPPRPRPRPPQDPDLVQLDASAQLRRLGGVWYHITLAPVPKDTSFDRAFDVTLGRRLAVLGPSWQLGTLLQQRYGRWDRYAVAKRQLGKKELRQIPPELRV